MIDAPASSRPPLRPTRRGLFLQAFSPLFFISAASQGRVHTPEERDAHLSVPRAKAGLTTSLLFLPFSSFSSFSFYAHCHPICLRPLHQPFPSSSNAYSTSSIFHSCRHKNAYTHARSNTLHSQHLSLSLLISSAILPLSSFYTHSSLSKSQKTSPTYQTHQKASVTVW